MLQQMFGPCRGVVLLAVCQHIHILLHRLSIQRTLLSLLQHMLAVQSFHPLVLLVLLVLVDQFKPSRDCWSQHHVVQTRTRDVQVS